MSDEIGMIYDEVGEEAIRGLVSVFYKQVPNDDLLGPMYPKDDMEGAEKRLADFIIFRLGGPDMYLQERGHPRLRMRHMPFKIGLAERNRWMQMMQLAMDEVAFPESIKPKLLAFFGMVADAMVNKAE